MPVVAQCMTRTVVHVLATASIHSCAELFEEHGFRHLPTIDEAGRVEGLLDCTSDWFNKARTSLGLTARDVAETPAMVRADTDLADVLGELSRGGPDAVVVVDDDRRLGGIFTSIDAMRIASMLLARESVEPHMITQFGTVLAMSRPGPAARHAELLQADHLVVTAGGKAVGAVTRGALIGASPTVLNVHALIADQEIAPLRLNSSLGEAAGLMVTSGHAVLVVADATGRPVGTLTARHIATMMVDRFRTAATPKPAGPRTLSPRSVR